MLRVAAYARVSTDKDDQINSLTNQRLYFESCINSHEDWEFAGVYFDEGVTGTQTKKRMGFNRMIDVCRAGKIDLILTKEVSRFARNTVDALNYTRMLKDYGVGVMFISDNIDTRENDGEFRLSIMASVAQEESRKTSERVKWGQRRAMENGVVFGNNSIFGFDISGGVLAINEKEAAVVRLIFHKYINEGKGTHVIARELYDSDIKPPLTSKGFWSSTMILRILRNEKYVGDLLQKKYITKDYLTHKKIPNDGEKIFIPNHHEAIIDRDTWDRTQEELRRRSVDAERKRKYSNRYWCSGKIICSDCGSGFVIRRSRKKNGEYIAWACHSRVERGNRKTDSDGNVVGCNMRMINNKSLLECMRFVTEQTGVDFDSIADELADEITAMSSDEDDSSSDLIYRRIKETEDKKLRMLDSYFKMEIREQDMKKLMTKYDAELDRLNMQLRQKEEHIINDKQGEISELRSIIIENAIYSESVYGEILEEIVVYDEYMIMRLKYLDFGFKITYSTHGYKENYTTVIEKCEIVEFEK